MVAALLAALTLSTPELGVVYARPGGVELAMDIHKPRTSGTPAPAVVVIHGGGWMAGKRQDMTAMAQALAREGFVAATISYRLAPGHPWPAMLDDCQSAVRYLRANAAKHGVDPSRIGAAGASAGGHLALLLGTRETRDPDPEAYPGYSSKVSAVLDLFGPTDFQNDFGPGFAQLVPMVMGKPVDQAMPEIEDASPLKHVTRDDAPIFIFHGKADRLVPLKQSQRLEARCKEQGVPVETAYLPGLGHKVDLEREDVRRALQRGVAWLKRHLRLKR